VGWSAGLFIGWRLALWVAAISPLLIWIGLGKAVPPQPVKSQADSDPDGGSLPVLFWVYWVTIVLAVSVEFCMISWSADYLENSLHMLRANAAQSVSLFLGGMILGRMAVSRLVQRFAVSRVVTASIILAGIGFVAFWTTNIIVVGLVGLFVTGLGVAGMYPLLLSLAIGVAKNKTTQASARATLASGTAILVLPLLLGRLADMVGIRQAYGVVGVLLVSVFLITLIVRRKS
jgi:fucose permease